MTQTVLLGDLIENGEISIHNTLRAPLNSRERSERQGEYPYFGATSQMDSINEFKFNGFYILVAEDGTVFGGDGVSPMIQRVRGKFWVSNHAHVLQGVDETDTKYLAIALESSDVRPNITGAVQLKLSKSNLFKIKVYWPQRQEREAILSRVDPVDEKIELNRKMNETLEQMGQALFKHYFITNPAAKEWSEKALIDFADHIKVGVKPMDSIEKMFSQYSIPAFDDSMTTEKSVGNDIKSNKYRVIDGSILVSKLNPMTPRIWPVLTAENNAICSTEFQVVRPKKHFCFIYFILTSVAFSERMTRMASGTSNSHRRVRPDDIFNYLVISPPEELIDGFESAMVNTITLIDKNRKQIQTLIALRDTLLPRLISGKVKV